MKKRKLRICLISSFVPKKCGIATYSRDLIEAVEKNGDAEWSLIAAEAADESYTYKNKEIAIIKKNSLESYQAAADAINQWCPDVVLLGHEYGIFGGSWVDIVYRGKKQHNPTGDHILTLLDNITAPVVTTLHTVIPEPDKLRKDVMRSISKRSSKLVAMTIDAKETMKFYYGIEGEHISVIPHGVPRPLLSDKRQILKGLGLGTGRFYLLTTGLIGPNKGIEIIIKAMPRILKSHPEALLLVVGQTHPSILATEGEAYRDDLIRLADKLGVGDSVKYVNKYLTIEKLVEYFAIADLYLTIHKDPEQAASGTLAYALGCGLATISTPYRYAKEVLSDGRGFLVPFSSSKAIEKQVNALIEDKKLLNNTRKKARALGRMMSWSKVADAYLRVIKDIVEE